MDNSSIKSLQLGNGLTLIAECMPWLESASFAISVPAGCQFDPESKLGLANFVCEMVQRGCGSLDSRQFIEKLESIGVDYSSSVSVYHTHFGGALPARKLADALQVYSDVLRNPVMPEDQMEDGRMVCMQEIRAIEDDLPQRVMLSLRQRQYGDPLGRSCQGNYESIQSVSYQDVGDFYRQFYRPNGLVIGVAGNIDWDALCQQVESLFGDWQEVAVDEIQVRDQSVGVHHIDFESQQTHIGLAFPSIPYSNDNYFVARGAVGVLSDGMSSRLFSEIREKRGLCYSVYASLHSLKDRGSIISYVGTGADRAQQSLDVLIEELTRLSEGITNEELERLKIQVRSSLVMQQESSRSRASSISSDYFHLGRARTLDEVNQLINDLSVERINKYLADNPPANFNLVTLGSQPLEFTMDT